MARSLAQIGEDLKPILDSGDETRVAELFDELIRYLESNAQDVEALLGWGILVATESGLECAGEYRTWFMEQFPESVLPVKIEYADYLAGNGNFDEATQIAREYLRLITDSGHIENLEEFTNVRAGASKAFLLLTAAYTESGARSYSRRVLEYASGYPLHPSFLARYQVELERLRDELQDEGNRQLNETWESFFQDGTHADELCELCQQRDCPMLARRVDLLEGNFRFKRGFGVGTEGILWLVVNAEIPSKSEPAQMLV